MTIALHFDCFSGISGDMTLGALIDLGVEADAIRAGLNSLRLPIELHIDRVRKGGFTATQVWVQAPEETEDRYLPDIEAILSRGSLTESQRDLALRIFRNLARAEAAVHGLPIERVHFHEVGALDSIADIAGVAIGIDLLGVERFTSRSVVTGHGMVKCAHGVMPVPTPATAELLKGAPLASSTIKAELTTPTGAAILATLVQDWVESPNLRVKAIGHGAGMKDFLDQPNLLRLFLGEVASSPVGRDVVWMLETNLDDIPGEMIGYCFEQLFAVGALDVFTTPIQMKKNRPGILLSVIVPDTVLETAERILFQETGTFGIRKYRVERAKLERETLTVETPWGQVRCKHGWRGDVQVFSPEYEDCARVARQHGIALRDVFAAARRAAVRE